MRLGFSRGWPVALEAMTGSKQMSVRPLLNYFAPLFDFIDAELERNGESVCFGDEVSCAQSDTTTNKKLKRTSEEEKLELEVIKAQFPCDKDDSKISQCEDAAVKYLNGRYERRVAAWGTRGSHVEWAYSTDLGNETAREESEKVHLEEAKFEKEEHKEIISHFPWKKFTNESLKRQLKFVSDLGVAALPEDDVSQVSHNRMYFKRGN